MDKSPEVFQAVTAFRRKKTWMSSIKNDIQVVFIFGEGGTPLRLSDQLTSGWQRALSSELIVYFIHQAVDICIMPFFQCIDKILLFVIRIEFGTIDHSPGLVLKDGIIALEIA